MSNASNAIVTLNRQEAFNRAWEGLKAQGFKQCLNSLGSCSFLGVDGTSRCAWGHVDPKGTAPIKAGGIITCGLGGEDGHKINLAVYLGQDDLDWGAKLQHCHDESPDPEQMKARLIAFARAGGLAIPGVEGDLIELLERRYSTDTVTKAITLLAA